MKRVLIVDDEPHVIRVIRLALEREGYEVFIAAHGEDALEQIHQSVPDVLITDIQMPRMTGQALCARIEKELPDRDFPIVLMTSRTEIEHRQWSRQVPNMTFMEKPVSVRRLVALLNRYRDGRWVAERAADA